jgi:hypothetical protein
MFFHRWPVPCSKQELKARDSECISWLACDVAAQRRCEIESALAGGVRDLMSLLVLKFPKSAGVTGRGRFFIPLQKVRGERGSGMDAGVWLRLRGAAKDNEERS